MSFGQLAASVPCGWLLGSGDSGGPINMLFFGLHHEPFVLPVPHQLLPPSVLLRLFWTSAFGKTSGTCFLSLPSFHRLLLGLMGNPSAPTCRASLGGHQRVDAHILLTLCLLSTAGPSGLSTFSFLIKRCWARSFPRMLEYFLRMRVLAGVGELVGGWLLLPSLVSSTSLQDWSWGSCHCHPLSTWSGYSRKFSPELLCFPIVLGRSSSGDFFKCFKRSACSELGYRAGG